jgi:hypothetical protein
LYVEFQGTTDHTMPIGLTLDQFKWKMKSIVAQHMELERAWMTKEKEAADEKKRGSSSSSESSGAAPEHDARLRGLDDSQRELMEAVRECIALDDLAKGHSVNNTSTCCGFPVSLCV